MRYGLPLLLLWPVVALAQEPFSGEIDLRNRFVVRDDYPVYRSIVNLSRGPRLFGIQGRYEGKDKISLTGNSIGDPNSMVRLDARRSEVYEASFSYRTIAYFNNLPSYGNPLLAQGVTASQRFLDLSRRQYDFDLRLRPDSKVIPFFNLLRTHGGGNGITPFVGSGDEFPVPATLRDSLTTVRGGVELRSTRWSGSVEQGWTNYTDQQDLDNTSRLEGNRPQDGIVLDRIRERYHAEGTGMFTRGVVQGHPVDQLSFTGHFIYSRPKMETSYSLDAQGVFRDPNTLRPYTSLLESSFANATQPRTSGSWTTEYRPWRQWRARHTWVTDAYRISSSSPTTAVLTQPIDPARGILELRYHQSEAEITGELGKHLTVRGGHRYIHSDAELPPANLSFPGSTDTPQIRRHAALGGATLTLWKGRMQTHGSYEWSPGGKTYFRMGLLNYRKAHVLSRIRVSNKLRLTASQRELQNDNRGDTSSNHITTVTAEWTPDSGQRVTLVGAYAREYMISRATFANPVNLQIQNAPFDDRLNHVNGYADIRIARGAQLQAGGSVSHSEGSRPTRYYTPQSQLVLASRSRVSAVMEWRWYRYRAIEEFRAHTVSVGVRIRFGAKPAGN